jgi:hypothetical protein
LIYLKRGYSTFSHSFIYDAVMMLRHKLAGLVWGAILVIAIQLAPNFAFAHSGHARHSNGVVSSAIDSEASEPSRKESVQIVTASSPYNEPCSSAAGCTGTCCCGTGMCCGGAVANASSPALPEARFLTEVGWPLFDRRSGIDPDALGRPPKILA